MQITNEVPYSVVLKERLNQKITVIDQKIDRLSYAADSLKNGIDKDNDFVSHFKKHGNITALTRPIVTELIDEILIHEGGDVEIVFKFNDAYMQVVEYIELNKHLLEPQKPPKKTA